MEAMFRLCWQGFEEWFRGSSASAVLRTENQTVLLAVLKDLREYQSLANLKKLVSLPGYAELFDAFSTFVTTLKSPLARFWASYFTMVHVLLQFIRGTQTGNWPLHLASVQRMLPWMFAYDRNNYCRCLSLYWCQMTALEALHATVHDQFIAGEFGVQRSFAPFSQIAIDPAIEQTVNHHTKTAGGIVGFSQKPGAVQEGMVNASAC